MLFVGSVKLAAADARIVHIDKQHQQIGARASSPARQVISIWVVRHVISIWVVASLDPWVETLAIRCSDVASSSYMDSLCVSVRA